MKRLLGGAGAALGVKILTGFAVAAAAATIAAAATEVAITGSVNPLNWGQQVTQQVEACKASAARLGVHGIGQCVSSFARQHGDAVSDSHSKKDSHPTGNANGKDKSKSHGQGSDKSQGSRPSITTAGEPTDPADTVHSSIPPQR